MHISAILNRVTSDDLRTLCQEFGVDSNGNKKTLITRLLGLDFSQIGAGRTSNQLEINGEPYRYIFSFGSNNIKQLLNRCREAEEVKKICCGWRSDLLDIVKPYIKAGQAQDVSRSFFSTSINWGGAVSTLISNPGQSTRGILIPMPEKFLPCLDKFEGVHIGKYSRNLIDVNLVDINDNPTGEVIEAIAYTGNIKDKFKIPDESVVPTEAYVKAVARTMRDYRQLLGQKLEDPYQIDIRRNESPAVFQTVTLLPEQLEETFDIRKKLINYELGNLPIILTSPHGGSASSVNFIDESGKLITPPIRPTQKPSGYKDVYSTLSDQGANFLTKNLADQLAILAEGAKPYQIKALFARKLVDVDRPLESAIPITTGKDSGETTGKNTGEDVTWNRKIYELYQQTLEETIQNIRQKFPDQPIIIIDVHRIHSKDTNSTILIGVDGGINLNVKSLDPTDSSIKIDTVTKPGYTFYKYNQPDQGIFVIPIEVSNDLITDKDLRLKISNLLAPAILEKIQANYK